MELKVIIGVDVSKSDLDYVAIPKDLSWESLQKTQVKKLENASSKIASFLSHYNPTETLVVFEPTGTYSDKLASVLSELGFKYALANPKKAHAFSQMMGIHHKTDQTAARLLAYMGSKLELPRYSAPSQEMKERKQLLSAICALEKERQQLVNRLHAQEQYHQPHPKVMAIYEELVQVIEGKIQALESALKALDDQSFQAQKQLLISIKGIGPVTAHWLLILSNSMTDFTEAKQLVSFCGLSPRKHYSGTSVRFQGGITKQAVAKLRGTLFMAAKSAIRYNAACKDLYQRLRARGKGYYKAMVAVMAKLVKQAFGVLKSGKEYDDQYYLKYQKN